DLAKWENFKSRDLREIGLGIGKALAFANEIICTEDNFWPYNSFESSYKQFHKHVFDRLTESA
ncbi:MAG: hypothetical protein KAJ30_03840, partial [Candidatus Heimdallarchaeota archaeon]|nr:hypothetical protein [Candidatus Heimdallarchaeota archaeon]